MALNQVPTTLEEEEEDVEEQEGQFEFKDGPFHHPSAPSDELFDISTTVDPSYVISLIRKLLPTNLTGEQELQTKNSGESVASISRDGVTHLSENVSESMDLVEDSHELAHGERVNDETYCEGVEQPGHDMSVREEAWEENGCVLWDLAASKTHAELMVENLLLEVLSANLMLQQSVRATEVNIGIIGNLACHEVPMKHIVSTSGLIELIVNQLFIDDAQCLCEVFRVLCLGVRSSESIAWAAALQSERILCRILWIAENTLNRQLIEKSIELLLAISESSQEVVHILIPLLMKMGLPSLLTSLLACEISVLTNERVTERLSILDVLLRAIEAISIIDGPSQEISSNKELFYLVCALVKFPDKAEIANSCVTAAVLIANIMSDVADLDSEMSNDLTFLQGLLDIFPFASDDLEARGAVWNIIARLLFQVRENEMSPTSLHQYVSVLASKSELIEDDLLDHQLDGLKSKARTTALRRIITIINQWTSSNDGAEEENAANVARLLDCCQKHAV
ncbi:hypothetical protein L484_014095 [Morus notabilis]|uniref:Protein saal1 n=1 Tax=Morus notabilis TaxID=981085 RepID=W9RK65_9ROSA|nr:uncharacterized protein LOC21397245 [Morus notabilis]EXB81611.1 hypothetical protein L484_014095 [Morus notabilis]